MPVPSAAGAGTSLLSPRAGLLALVLQLSLPVRCSVSSAETPRDLQQAVIPAARLAQSNNEWWSDVRLQHAPRHGLEHSDERDRHCRARRDAEHMLIVTSDDKDTARRKSLFSALRARQPTRVRSAVCEWTMHIGRCPVVTTGQRQSEDGGQELGWPSPPAAFQTQSGLVGRSALFSRRRGATRKPGSPSPREPRGGGRSQA